MEIERLLSVPDGEASLDDWEEYLPIDELPDLPERKNDYYIEPWIGISVVTVMSVGLIWSTEFGSTTDVAANASKVYLARKLIWVWAAIAVLCTLYIVYGEAGVIERSPETCYPIPEEVAEKLLQGVSLVDTMANPKVGDSTYCVRCLVWRPRTDDWGQKCHHCSTCQRCVTGFDHHCGVFGRCIVRGNMPCFVLLISMMMAGWVTASMAFFAGGDSAMRGVMLVPPTNPSPPAARLLLADALVA